jgi:hypothetical protein
MCGVALATAGFIIATKDFGVPFKEVLMHHGTLGVAILVLVYVQVRSSLSDKGFVSLSLSLSLSLHLYLLRQHAVCAITIKRRFPMGYSTAYACSCC